MLRSVSFLFHFISLKRVKPRGCRSVSQCVFGFDKQMHPVEVDLMLNVNVVAGSEIMYGFNDAIAEI